MKNNYLVLNESVDPYYNLALEEYLLTHYQEGNIVMLWQNDNTIVIGRHQNAVEEINQQYVKEHHIKVARRITGGGAVYHDLGNLNYSFITDWEESKITKFTQLIVEALQKMGVQAEFTGRNDILVGEKKVAGTAQRIYHNRILYHGCLLYDSDLSVVAQSLNVRAEKFHSKAVRSVRARVENIKEFLEQPVTIEEFRESLRKAMVSEGQYEVLRLGMQESEEVKKLRDRKYATWKWTYNSPIKYTAHNYRKYEGGTVESYVNVENGRIKECQMYGDFMALRPASEVAERLIGCRYRYEDIREVLQEFRITEYFGRISAEEVALSICCAE